MSTLGGKTLPSFDWARLLRRLPGLVCVTERDGRMVAVSGRLFDEDPDVLVITHVWQLVTQDHRSKLRDAIERAHDERQPQQVWVQARRLEGCTFVVEIAPAEQHVVSVWAGVSEVMAFDDEEVEFEPLDPEPPPTAVAPPPAEEPEFLLDWIGGSEPEPEPEPWASPEPAVELEVDTGVDWGLLPQAEEERPSTRDPWDPRLAETEAGVPRRDALWPPDPVPAVGIEEAPTLDPEAEPVGDEETVSTRRPRNVTGVEEMDALFPKPRSPERATRESSLSFTAPDDGDVKSTPVTGDPRRAGGPDYVIVAPQDLRRLAGRLQRALDLATPHTAVWFEDEFDKKVSRLAPSSRVIFLGSSKYGDFMRRVVKARSDTAGACWGVMQRKALIWTHDDGDEREVARALDGAMSRAGRVSLSRTVGSQQDDPPTGKELAGKFLMEPSPRRPTAAEEKYILGVSMFLLDGFEEFHKSVES